MSIQHLIELALLEKLKLKTRITNSTKVLIPLVSSDTFSKFCRSVLLAESEQQSTFELLIKSSFAKLERHVTVIICITSLKNKVIVPSANMSVSSSSDLPYSDDDDDKPHWSVRAKPTTGTFGNSVKLTQFTRSNSVDGGMCQGAHPVHVDYIRVSQYTTV